MRLVLISLLALTLVAAAEKPRVPKPPLQADQYPQHDTHLREQVTIAAESCESPATRPDTRLDYAAHNFLPVRIIITNNSSRALTLDDARIHFISADNAVLPAATTDDLQRGLFTLKSATGTKHNIPLGPVQIPITTGKKKIDKDITADDTDFGFKTTTIAPHATVAGYLYYDMSEVDPPVLVHATLELRKVRWAAATLEQPNTQLENFEIPLQPLTDKPQ